MKLLFDQNLSYKLPSLLEDLFPGSAQVRTLGLDQADDQAVRDYAAANGFAVVTQDADFADLTFLHGAPPKVVWLRCGNKATRYVCDLLRGHALRVLALPVRTRLPRDRLSGVFRGTAGAYDPLARSASAAR